MGFGPGCRLSIQRQRRFSYSTWQTPKPSKTWEKGRTLVTTALATCVISCATFFYGFRYGESIEGVNSSSKPLEYGTVKDLEKVGH